MPYYNSDLPESVNPKATPTEAIVGRLSEGCEVEQMIESLAAGGIESERIHILQGPDGIEFLNGVGSFLGRLFGDEKRDLPIEMLGEGATLVGIFGVADADQQSVAAAAVEAGIEVIRRYGKWTYS